MDEWYNLFHVLKILPIPNYSLLLLDNSPKVHARCLIVKLQVLFSQVKGLYIEQKTSSKGYCSIDYCYFLHSLLAKYTGDANLLLHFGVYILWSLSFVYNTWRLEEQELNLDRTPGTDALKKRALLWFCSGQRQ